MSSLGGIENKVFRFKFNISSDKNLPENEKRIFSEILKMTGTVLHLYSFEDYKGVEFINGPNGERKVYLSKEDLEKFRKNKLNLEKLL